MSRLKINERLIVKCHNHEQVKNALKKLNELGYEIEFNEVLGNIVCFDNYDKKFTNLNFTNLNDKNIVIEYKIFIKIYERQKEKLKKDPDLLIDKNGKILKVNNIDKTYHVFYYDNNLNRNYGIDFKGLFLAEDINKTDFYTSLEALEKTLKRKEIENKLKALAFDLNGNKDINWNDDKYKFYLDYCYEDKTIVQYSWRTIKHQGTIYSYSEVFKDKAIELIGEEELKEYLKNC